MKLDCVEKGVSSFFGILGKWVGAHPTPFIVVPLILSAALSTGLFFMDYKKDIEYLFTPTEGRGKLERNTMEALFPLHMMNNSDVGRLVSLGHHARVIIMAKDHQTVLRRSIYDQIMVVDSYIQNITILHNDTEIRYKDICLEKRGSCFKNGALSLYHNIDRIANRTQLIKYPLTIDTKTYRYTFYGIFLGGVDVDAKGYVKNALAIGMYYFVDQRSDYNEKGRKWEEAFLEVMSSLTQPDLDIYYVVSFTMDEEVDKNLHSVFSYVPSLLLLITFFSVASCMMSDWVKSKPWLGVLGVISTLCAVGTSGGLCAFCGVTFISINLAIIFLMLGTGMDNTFVLLAAWRRTDPRMEVADRLSQTYKHAGVSITITSLTNLLSFMIGIITPFPSLFIFCTYTSVAIFFTYTFHITFFGGCMAIYGYIEQRNLHSFFPLKKTKPKSMAANDGFLFKLMCTGGFNPDDPENPKDNKENTMSIFFGKKLGEALGHKSTKSAIVFTFLIYIGFSMWGMTFLREGIERKRLGTDDSYATAFFEVEDLYFRKYPFRIQIAVNHTLDYSDVKVQGQIETMLQKFESSPFTSDSTLTESWLREYLKFTRHRQGRFLMSQYNISKKEDFLKGLTNVFFRLPPARDFKDDVVFNENRTDIIASRFMIHSSEIRDSNEEKNMVLHLRKIADSFPFNVTVYNWFFVLFDQHILIQSVTIQSIASATLIMIFVLLLFIPSLTCAMWVAFAIISIEAGVIGFMALWNVSLDCIAMIGLIMCVGFSVDYSAHISYAYISSKERDPNKRMQEALYDLGLPIFQGCISTLLGVTPLYFAPSYIFSVFFKVTMLVIVLASLHGMFLLPVLLTFSPWKSIREKLPVHFLSGDIDYSEYSIKNALPIPQYLMGSAASTGNFNIDMKKNIVVISDLMETLSHQLAMKDFVNLGFVPEEPPPSIENKNILMRLNSENARTHL
ncbi:daf-6 [Cordylochernes scorpioides]|uniref:Daf-6 n=1 Tax=Cordylochernes scorpioides TaxID=51811 RepID=A0ABY6K673_9ARAC|nr:daf-6 [Cordylochernes scorpioides]